MAKIATFANQFLLEKTQSNELFNKTGRIQSGA
jgi:hypothetical protein